VRVAAVRALQRLDVSGAGETLLELTKTPVLPELRGAVAESLGWMGFKGSVEGIQAISRQEGALGQVRSIIRGLAYSGRAEAREVLESIVSGLEIDSETLGECVSRARLQLELSLSGDPLSAALPFLHSEDPEMRRWATMFLSRARDPLLAVHLRQSVESLRDWPTSKRRVHYRMEFDLLSALGEAGGVLTSQEQEFMEAVVAGRTAVPP
jgi:hypothetical protein